MNTTTIPARLRPLTDAEQTAVDMRATDKTMEEICDQTGLTRPQIAAACELREKFGQILGKAEVVPVVTAKANGVHVAPKRVEGAPAKPTTTPPAAVEDDIETLLAAAEKSPQPRAQALAVEIRNGIATLRTLIGNDEKFRKLTALVEVHRKHLAETEAELAALIGDVAESRARDDRPEIVIDLEPFDPGGPAVKPEPAALTAGQTAPIQPRDRLAYDPKVRAWAIGDGWEVAAAGRMSGAVVAAYLKAHPSENQPEAAAP